MRKLTLHARPVLVKVVEQVAPANESTRRTRACPDDPRYDQLIRQSQRVADDEHWHEPGGILVRVRRRDEGRRDEYHEETLAQRQPGYKSKQDFGVGELIHSPA